MNDIARPAPSMTDDVSAARTKLTVQSLSRELVHLSGAATYRGVRLMRRLDRLNSAVSLGLVPVDPRSALALARLLGPRIPLSTSTPDGDSVVPSRREVS